MLTNAKTGLLQAAARFLPSLPSPIQALVRVAHVLAVWENRARERKALAEMPPNMLKDIGISRIDAHRETDKPFWRA
jgi:uncharacterized protein YjiS (DUF1127 family)